MTRGNVKFVIHAFNSGIFLNFRATFSLNQANDQNLMRKGRAKQYPAEIKAEGYFPNIFKTS
jgi:hypothetical protein